MHSPWVHPKIIIGNTATGDYYYNRPEIVARIWAELEKGNHVLLAAPRRVGKSSVMKFMAENAVGPYRCIFENIQGIESAESFFKTLYKLIKSCLSLKQKSIASLHDFFKEIKIEEVSATGTIKFGNRSISYQEALDHILPRLRSTGIVIVLFIDELPEVLHNLYKKNKTDEAISILKNLRRWRQDDQFKNFRLVLAGSVGIHHVIKLIEGRTVDKNDFNEVAFEPLQDKAEAMRYIQWATSYATIPYDEELCSYLLSKVRYYLPYFINLMLDEIDKKAHRANKRTITAADIDAAFDDVVENNDHFSDWKSRLFDYMSAEDAEFLNDVLIYIAHEGHITTQKLFDLALKHSKTLVYMDLVFGLKKDGYIAVKDGKYFFVSPFLQAFWKNNNPVLQWKTKK